jgi:hypothetical protein
VPSLLRGFSAPVVLDYDYSDTQLLHLLAHDSDPFNRWEAGQRLAMRARWQGPGEGTSTGVRWARRSSRPCAASCATPCWMPPSRSWC